MDLEFEHGTVYVVCSRLYPVVVQCRHRSLGWVVPWWFVSGGVGAGPVWFKLNGRRQLAVTHGDDGPTNVRRGCR